MPASVPDSSAPTPVRTPPPAQRPGLRQRLRALRLRLRAGARVELRGRPLLGPGLRFDVAPGARLIVGDGASLGERCRVHVHAGTVTIGEGAVLGERCVIVARTGVHIGERCVLGDEVAITDFGQRFDDVETPIRLQELVSSPVRIEEGAVLGPRAAILRGVRVGAGAHVGAHAVVTRDVAAGATVEGKPARPVRSGVPDPAQRSRRGRTDLRPAHRAGMIAPMESGEQDIARAAADLASRVPKPLAALARIAYNYRWSWFPEGPGLFGSVDPHRWELCGENPVRLLQEASGESLSRAAADPELLARAALIERTLRAELAGPAAPDPPRPERPVAFFCAEYAVHRSLPVYAGGLGALAGDFLKEASDRAMPLVAVGLMYRQGYFHQRIDTSGYQHEYWFDTDPERRPIALVTGADGRPLTVSVPIWEEQVVAQIWRVDVGRVPLFLLDAERPENSRLARWITSQLYVGDPITRLAQYALLGIGGVRALEALGVEPSLIHLNEGHAALASLELARAETARGVPLNRALEAARQRVVFTTHTPVPAGNDTYPAEEVSDALGTFAAELGLDIDEFLRLGRSHPDDAEEPPGVTQLALRMSRTANGVSRRHGAVARAMWQALWPERPIEGVPITHVTNGVHLPSWLGSPMRRLLDRHLGEDWPRRAADPATWAALDAVPDSELWAVRNQQRAELVDFVRDRSMADRLTRGEAREYVQAAARAFDPGVLTIGFARRVATYKRLHLLVQDPERSLKLLADERPIQIVLAGKAHPNDEEAKRVVQGIFSLKGAPHVGARVIYLHDYDLGMAGRLVQGCDVWVNLPRPPLEASGTSGMKSVANGGLQLSVLDGWWPEAYDGANGWALSGDIDSDHAAQDARDSAELYRLLEQEIVPAFYARDAGGLPREWISRIRSSMRSIVPMFCAGRMLDDYTEHVYRTQGSPGA